MHGQPLVSAANARNCYWPIPFPEMCGNWKEKCLVWLRCARPEKRFLPAALNDRIARRKPATQKETDIQPMSLAEMEKKLILAVLHDTTGNRTHAAEILGISREGLRTKMQKLGLSPSADQ